MPQLSPIPRQDCLPVSLTHLTVLAVIQTISLFHSNLLSCLGLLLRDMQVLYTDFSASRQRELLAFPRCAQTATSTPNLDSATAINNRFYCSPDPHSAFDCDNRCTTAWVWRFSALHCIGRPLQHSQLSTSILVSLL